MRKFLLSSLAMCIATFAFAQGNGNGNGNNNTPVCHNGNTIYVNQNAVQAHLNHGDVLGTCDGCIDPNLINNEIFCLAIYDPVCGCDGNTYSNGCVATYQFGVTSFTQGECGCLTDPLTDVFCPLYVDPVCGCNGVTYSNSCFATIAGVTSWTQGPCEFVLDPRSTTADGHHEDHDHTLHPNPANEVSWFSYNATMDGRLTVTLYDLTGKELSVAFNQNVVKHQQIKAEMNLSTLPNGAYIVRAVLPDGQQVSDKLMIAH